MKRFVLAVTLAMTMTGTAGADNVVEAVLVTGPMDALAASNGIGVHAQNDMRDLGIVGKVLGLGIGIVSFPVTWTANSLVNMTN